MNNRSVEKEIERITKKVAAKFQPEKVILFGSWVWGHPVPGSDVDLFVVKKSRRKTLDLMRQVDRILLDRVLPLDILVYTPNQLKRRLELGDPFVKKILSEGRVLYDKIAEDSSTGRRVA